MKKLHSNTKIHQFQISYYEHCTKKTVLYTPKKIPIIITIIYLHTYCLEFQIIIETIENFLF